MTETRRREVNESERIVYVRRPTRPGEALFSEVSLPDGTIIRRVDEAVHLKALANASKRYREKLNGG